MSKKLKPLIVTAMLAAVAVVLFFLEFPLFPAAGHLKLDFSDIPALVGALVFGPACGVLIELLKNLIELIIKGVGTQMGFGNLMNFAVGVAFVLPFSLVVRRAKKQGKPVGASTRASASCAGMLALLAAGLAMNFLITPLFFRYFLKIPLTTADVLPVVGFAEALNAIKGAILIGAGCALTGNRQLERLLRG
ncbi:MAG: ECF transporter S component [Oscillospiraceae bacterium]|nr:ECF transporter S component [Oscillospiraceae bacterium]